MSSVRKKLTEINDSRVNFGDNISLGSVLNMLVALHYVYVYVSARWHGICSIDDAPTRIPYVWVDAQG